MPYICLARTDIPDGVLQILDLQPNTSQVNGSIGGLGQTKYVNRVENDTVLTRGTTTLITTAVADGLTAYLIDNVVSGGLTRATGTVTSNGPGNADAVTISGQAFTCVENYAVGSIIMNGPADADTFTVKTIVFRATENVAIGSVEVIAGLAAGDSYTLKTLVFNCINGAPNPALYQFQDIAGSGSIQASSDTLVAAINEVTTVQPAMALVAPAGVVCAATNAGGTSPIVTLTASARGLQGQFAQLQTGNHLTIVAMVAAVPDPVTGRFAGILQAVGGTNIAVASSALLAVNEATTIQPAMALVAPAGVVCAATNAGGTSATVTLTAAPPSRGLQGQLDLTESTAGARMTRSGATMIATVPNPAAQEFAGILQAVGLTDTAVAASLVLAINNPASQVLMDVGTGAVTATSAVGVVTLTANAFGAPGNLITLVTNDIPQLPISGALLTGAGIGCLSAANASTIATRLLNKLGCTITGSTAATPSVITATAHGLSVGETISIVGHSNAALNGTFVVGTANFAANTFTVGVGAAVAGTGGTVTSEFTNCTRAVITTASIASPSLITTTAAHGYALNDIIAITGNSCATVNTSSTVASVPSPTTFTLTGVNNVTAAIGTGGFARRALDNLPTINNAASNVVANTEIIDSAGTASTATLAGLLQILAGRGYRLPSGSTLQTTSVKSAAAAGAFLETLGSGTFSYTKDIKGLRATYDGEYLSASEGAGVLAYLQQPQRLNSISHMVGDRGTTGKALDAAGNPILAYTYHGGFPNTALTTVTSRVVAVYQDDGKLY